MDIQNLLRLEPGANFRKNFKGSLSKIHQIIFDKIDPRLLLILVSTWSVFKDWAKVRCVWLKFSFRKRVWLLGYSEKFAVLNA